MDYFPEDREAKRQGTATAVRDVAPVIEAGIEQAERDCTLPMSVVEAMQAAGLFRLKLPAEVGGAEADPCTRDGRHRAVSAIYPSAGWVLMTNATGIGNAGAFLPDEAASQVFDGGNVRGRPRSAASAARSSPSTAVSCSTGSGRSAAACRTRGGFASARVCARTPGAQPDFYTCFVQTRRQIHDNWQVAGLRAPAATTSPCRTCSCRVVHLAALRPLARHPPSRRADFPPGAAGFCLQRARVVRAGRGRLALDLIKDVAMTKRRGRGPPP
jgi:alkylation response protein AidB-like acyl-CoA dehydrogenase